MSDQERADRFIGYDLAADLVDGADHQQLARRLAEEFSATRLDERRAIATFLRGLAAVREVIGEQRVLTGAADLVERGRHGS